MPTREYKLDAKQVSAAFILWLGIRDLRAPPRMEISLHPSGSATSTIEEPEPPEPEPVPVEPPPPPEPRPHKVLPPFATSEFNREGY